MCDDITTTGVIVTDTGADETDVENEIYRRIHNYLSSLYSYNEQVRAILSTCLEGDVHKGYFLPARDDKSAPEYVRWGAFLWGLRNDLQHGDYWCLSVERERSANGSEFYHLRFNKRHFDPTPKGSMESAGAYLAHAPESDQRYPLAYIGDFHRNLFNEFEQAFESWCSRNRA